jgi:hypothetical protein
MSECIIDKMRILNIKCNTCLDTGKLWDIRKSMLSIIDGCGSYDIFNCHTCSDGKWLNYSWTILIINDITIFNKNDTSFEKKIFALNTLINNKNKQDEETNLINQEQSDMAQYLDDTIILDNNSKCIWWYYMNKNYNALIKKKHISYEINKIGDTIANWFIESQETIDTCIDTCIIEFINYIKLDMKNDIIKSDINRKIVKEIKTDNITTYIILIIHNSIINEPTCNCFKNTKYMLNINYKVIKPKNINAVNMCNEYILNDY